MEKGAYTRESSSEVAKREEGHAPSFEHLWAFARKLASKGELEDARIYLSSALSLLENSITARVPESRSCWVQLYLESAISLLKGESTEERNTLEPVFSLALKALDAQRRLKRLLDVYGAGIDKLSSELSREGESLSSLLAEVKTLSRQVKQESYSYSVLKDCTVQLYSLLLYYRTLQHLVEASIVLTSSDDRLAANIHMAKASEVLDGKGEGYVELVAPWLVKLVKALTAFTRYSGSGHYMAYAEFSEKMWEASGYFNDPFSKFSSLALAYLFSSYGELLREIQGAVRKDSSKDVQRDASRALELFEVTGIEEGVRIASLVLELSKLLREYSSGAHEGVVKERFKSLLEHLEAPKRDGTKVESLLRSADPVKLAIKLSVRLALSRKYPLLLIEQPPLSRGYVTVQTLNGAVRFLNVGACKVRLLSLNGPDGSTLEIERGSDHIAPLGYIDVNVKNVIGTLSASYLRPDGSYEVLLVNLGVKEEKKEEEVFRSGIEELDRELKGGFRLGKAYVLLTGEPQALLSRLASSVYRQEGTYVLLVTTKQLLEVQTSQGKVEVVLCSSRERVEGEGISTVKGVEDLSLLNRVILSMLEEVSWEFVSGALVVLDVVSDVLLMHKLLIARKWINDLVPRVMNVKRGKVSAVFVLNPNLHGREEIYGIKELFENVIDLANNGRVIP